VELLLLLNFSWQLHKAALPELHHLTESLGHQEHCLLRIHGLMQLMAAVLMSQYLMEQQARHIQQMEQLGQRALFPQRVTGRALLMAAEDFAQLLMVEQQQLLHLTESLGQLAHCHHPEIGMHWPMDPADSLH
jgi:hypothetical protein